VEERVVRRDAPAKINLYLHVVGKRADGYHLLDSLVAFAAVGDSLEVRPAAALSLAVSGPFASLVADDDGNLVMRAARALAAAAGVETGARMSLEKRLPVAAGLGGGSADAAATLRALVELWGLATDEDQLRALGVSLGADVPACLAGQTVFVSGVGEKVAPAQKLPPVDVVLVNPGPPAPTGEVFAALRGVPSGPGRFAETPASASELAGLLASRRNDLERPAAAMVPAIGRVLRLLEAQPGCLLARMSGSGATCFGMFGEARAAEAGAAATRALHPEWWVAVAPLSVGRALSENRDPTKLAVSR
jgi:4-diphosphocytidyl-2-C-methyl-D-erythritol kinase